MKYRLLNLGDTCHLIRKQLKVGLSRSIDMGALRLDDSIKALG